MKILFACKEFPHSKIIGGPIIIYNRLKYLSERHEVSLISFIREEEKKYISSVMPFCKELKLIPHPEKRKFLKTIYDFFFSQVPHYFLTNYNSPEMRNSIAEMTREYSYDFIICEYSVMGQFIHNNHKISSSTKKIISVHECYYLARLKDFNKHRFNIKGIRELINLNGLKKYEFEMYQSANKTLTLTPQDKEKLLNINPNLNISVVPHGVDIEYFSFTDDSESELSVIFLGNYLHYPNVDAVLYFYNDMWQKVKEKFPEMKYYIVGQAPPKEILKLKEDNSIIVTGRVDDVRPYLRKGKVFICSVRLGGGFRGKILESMAIGRPVVSTSLGAEGIPANNYENIIIADDPNEFVNGIIELVNNKEIYKKMVVNARTLIEEKYSWEKGVEELEKVLEEML